MNRMAGQIGQVDIVINSLNEVLGDVTVPKNVKIKIENILDMLEIAKVHTLGLQSKESSRMRVSEANSLTSHGFPSMLKNTPRALVRGRVFDTLKENRELPIKINKALNELGEIANDINLHAYIRAQIWNIISALEKPE